jgi:hypothetical protein
MLSIDRFFVTSNESLPRAVSSFAYGRASPMYAIAQSADSFDVKSNFIQIS